MQRRPCPLALAAARKVLGKLVDQYADLDIEVAFAMETYARRPLGTPTRNLEEEKAQNAETH